MDCFLAKDAALKWLEVPSVYHIKRDELYELDEESFHFLKKCSSPEGCSAERNEFVDYCLDEKILTGSPVSRRDTPLRQSPIPSLRYLELQITDRCNLRCRHCYIGEKGRNELSPSQISAVLGEFEEMQGLRVLVTGGEPLLHSRFPEINAMLPEFSSRKILFTNGMKLDRDVLKGLNVHEIQISIDGLEHGHDMLRGKGTFRAAMEGVRRSLDSGFGVSISTMVHAGNLSEFDAMEELFRGMGIRDWTVDVPCATGDLTENKELQLTPLQGGKYLGYGWGDGLHGSTPGFACGLHLASVTADGTISRCTFYRDRPAGLIEGGLLEGWGRIRPVRLEELKCDCGHIETCRGGCRYRAELLGDPFGKDLYRCGLLL